MLRVEVDARSAINALTRAPEILQEELNRAVKEGLTIIQREARAVHRFTTRSGDARRSVQINFTDYQNDDNEVYLDTGIAIYSPRLHKGFGTWSQDPFLYEAAKAKKNEVIDKINEAVGRAIERVGLK